MKRLMIDANPAVPYLVSGRVNGIGRTNMELIRALDAMPREDIPFDISLFTQNVKGVTAKALNTRFKIRHIYLRNTPAFNKVSSALRLRELCCRYDLQHITHNFEFVAHPERCIVTIHDAMMFSYPEKFLNHDFARAMYPAFARKAKAVLTCSENSRREIAEYMDVNPDRIFVAPWGVDHSLLYPHETAPCRYTNGKPFFIAVSCDRGRKNTVSVVRAYLEFFKQRPGHHLILVWRNPSDEVRELIGSHPEVAGHIHFVPDISNEELADLYAGATCSFFPSKYEGFGLPIAESMACGTPVATCRNSSLVEVGGDVALYVEPEDTAAMAAIMEQFENGTLRKSDLLEANHRQSLNFTWERCSRLTLIVYRRCLNV